jgi:hypothetical protein
MLGKMGNFMRKRFRKLIALEIPRNIQGTLIFHGKKLWKIDSWSMSVRLLCSQSEAIACARRCRSSRLTGWWTRKEESEKMEGQGGGKAQGVADPKKDFHAPLKIGTTALRRTPECRTPECWTTQCRMRRNAECQMPNAEQLKLKEIAGTLKILLPNVSWPNLT